MVELSIGPLLSAFDMPLAVAGHLPAVALAEARASSPSPFRSSSIATLAAETKVAVPMRLIPVLVPVRGAAIVPLV